MAEGEGARVSLEPKGRGAGILLYPVIHNAAIIVVSSLMAR